MTLVRMWKMLPSLHLDLGPAMQPLRKDTKDEVYNVHVK